MFEQTIYKVLYAKLTADGQGTEWGEVAVKSIEFKDGIIVKATTLDDKIIEIDDTTTFARRATGMFDKTGNMIFGGDIVKATIQHKQEDAKELLLPIVWVNGAYCIAIEGLGEMIYLTQQNVTEMEVIGNVYQHGKVLEKPVDEAIFEAAQQSETGA